MKVKFLDTKTNKTAWENYPFSIWWWAEGNGACDCNRALAFGHEPSCKDVPYRYQAVDIEDHPDMSICCQIEEYNKDLFDGYKISTKQDILDYINNGIS